MCDLDAMPHGSMDFYLNAKIEIEFVAGLIASLSIIRLHYTDSFIFLIYTEQRYTTYVIIRHKDRMGGKGDVLITMK